MLFLVSAGMASLSRISGNGMLNILYLAEQASFPRISGNGIFIFLLSGNGTLFLFI